VSNKVTIIIVDDNEIDLMIGSRMISRVDPNIVVKLFLSGIALKKELKEQGDEILSSGTTIFLIDIYMPCCSGFDLVKDIGQILAEKDASVVYYLLSASIDTSDLTRINSNAKINEFIGKPLGIENLNKIIKDSQNG